MTQCNNTQHTKYHAERYCGHAAENRDCNTRAAPAAMYDAWTAGFIFPPQGMKCWDGADDNPPWHAYS